MKVAFRVDASKEIGTGHLMRCLTLAAAMAPHCTQLRFVCRNLGEKFQQMLQQKGYEVKLLDSARFDGFERDLRYSSWLGVSQSQDAVEVAGELADGAPWDWLVVDHYALDVRWQRLVRHVAARILVIDDLADREHDCEVLLDQNMYLEKEQRYIGKVPTGCRMLLGSRFALLREEFRATRRQIRARTGSVRRLLVFFGGADPGNLTGQAVRALARLGYRDLAVDVVIGAQHPYSSEIQAEAAEHGFRCHVQTDQMATLMATADLAIGAGGSATWERCCMGLPALTYVLADNQSRLVDDAASQGLLYAPAGVLDPVDSMQLHISALMDNPRLLRMISENGLRAVDGNGVRRVLRALGIFSIGIREATLEDAAPLHQWRNHDAIRRVSRNAEPIAWEDHLAWFKSVMDDPRRFVLIGEQDGKSVGVVRFDVADSEAEVSIYLVPDLLESGIGGDLLAAAESWLLAKHAVGINSINAHVMGRNEPSHGLFRSSGYTLRSSTYTKRVCLQ